MLFADTFWSGFKPFQFFLQLLPEEHLPEESSEDCFLSTIVYRKKQEGQSYGTRTLITVFPTVLLSFYSEFFFELSRRTPMAATHAHW